MLLNARACPPLRTWEDARPLLFPGRCRKSHRFLYFLWVRIESLVHLPAPAHLPLAHQTSRRGWQSPSESPARQRVLSTRTLPRYLWARPIRRMQRYPGLPVRADCRTPPLCDTTLPPWSDSSRILRRLRRGFRDTPGRRGAMSKWARR